MDDLANLYSQLNKMKSGIQTTSDELSNGVLKINESLKQAQKADAVKESRCVSGALISIMESGDVRIKFDSEEKRKEFYDNFK